MFRGIPPEGGMSKLSDAMSKKANEKPKWNRYPIWAPRFWHGMRLNDWMALMLGNGWRIHARRIPMALIITGTSVVNTALHGLQQLLYGRALAKTEIDEPHVFIVGHWRSGTTYLHELLVLDEQFAFPTTYECFAPNHFFVSSRLTPHILGLLLPSKRPMDNMAVSFKHPQEDEFALMAMGAPSPMLRLAFPNDPPPYMELLDMEGVAPQVLQSWKAAMQRFIQMQTYWKRKPLVLKSPPHTGRIEVLSELFPQAKFIHMVRDPFSLFPSTRRLWRALDEVQGLQIPRYKSLDEYVFAAFERMYRGFERQREKIDASRICDVRYEDLVKDPVAVVENLYERLDLGDFSQVRERIEAYVGEKKDYRATRHELEPEVMAAIRQRWAGYIEKYGYGQAPE
jgi:hypothetical protein